MRINDVANNDVFDGYDDDDDDGVLVVVLGDMKMVMMMK